ncbi:hypothetical protein GGR52DRAFT_588371 [Hypoxylon sp. FL1284]|nr:hypothetical protein GGR52DRAFT_588371 [Hypoxylon sp. FL1284]
MASSQSKGDGIPASKEVTSSPEASSEAQAQQKPPRPMPSRGLLFNDFDEAFRKIAKQGPEPDASTGKKAIQTESNLDKPKKSPEASRTQDANPRGPATQAFGRSLTDKFTTPTKPAPSVPAVPIVKKQIGKDEAILDDQMVDVPLDDNEDINPQAVEFRRYNNAATERNEMRQSQRPSEPPQGSLPTVPQDRRQGKAELTVGTTQDNTNSTNSTVSNSQHLLDADAQAKELMFNRRLFSPPPINPPSMPTRFNSRAKKNMFPRDSSLPSTDGTNGSSSDVFRYDNKQYAAAMCSSDERDVSQALKRLSKVGEASDSVLMTPEGSPGTKRAAQQLKGTAQYGTVAEAEQDEHRQGPQSKSSEQVRDVRVRIYGNPELEPQRAETQTKASTLTRTKAYLGLDKLARESTGDGDWITEATSDAGFNSHAIKMTGSSIANSSGDEKDDRPILSTHRPVIRHPAGKIPAESYGLRNLKEGKQQVMLPTAKVSVFPNNSDRLFSNAAKENSKFSPSLHRNVSNPFTRNNYARADTRGNFFANPVEPRGSPYDFRNSGSEYAPDVQIERQNAEGRLFDNDLQDGVLGKYLKKDPRLMSSEQQTVGSSRNVEVTPKQPCGLRHVDKMYPTRHKGAHLWRLEQQEKEAAGFGQCSFISQPIPTGRSRFEFELVSLEEAQRKQKQQRESGESDETEPAEVRYQRAKSSSLSAASPVAMPLPTFNRRQLGPRLSSDFSHSWTSLRNAFQDTPSPFSATNRDQPTPGSSTQDRSLLRQNGTPMAGGSDTSSTPTRQFLGRYRPRQLFGRLRDRRIASDQTVVVRNPLPHVESGLSLAAVEAIMEVHISEASRRRRAHWFYLMATLSIILPFFAILVLSGALNESLLWYTHGEVRRITIKQRNFIRNAFLAECCLYVILVASIIAVFTKKF